MELCLGQSARFVPSACRKRPDERTCPQEKVHRSEVAGLRVENEGRGGVCGSVHSTGGESAAVHTEP